MENTKEMDSIGSRTNACLKLTESIVILNQISQISIYSKAGKEISLKF